MVQSEGNFHSKYQGGKLTNTICFHICRHETILKTTGAFILLFQFRLPSYQHITIQSSRKSTRGYQTTSETFPTYHSSTLHEENTSMQYTEIVWVVQNLKFRKNFSDSFLIFAQNIDCGYTLEPPRRGGSNEYPQSMFWSKNKKIGIPLHTPVFL